jgi:hypothetical protein
MPGAHEPPADYRFNKLRDSGGSYRLTLVKDAVERADIDPRPPRPELANIPAGDGAWVGFDVDRYGSQQTRVEVRRAVTAELAPGERIVGEYPVSIRGKLGSAVILVPRQLIDALALETAERMTTIALAPGALLFVTEAKATASEPDVEAAIEAARSAVPGL